MAGTIINLPDHAILSSVGIPNLETSPVFCQQQEGWSSDLGEVEEANVCLMLSHRLSTNPVLVLVLSLLTEAPFSSYC